MKKVFIIDDNPSVLDSLSRTIPWEKVGCELAGMASDGVTGLSAVLREVPDILLADIRMPGLDGLGMVQRLNKEMVRPPLVIFITGYAIFQYAQTALTLGAFSYIMKPIDNEVLLDVLQHAVSKLQTVISIEQVRAENLEKQTIIDKNYASIAGGLLKDCLSGEISNETISTYAHKLSLHQRYYVLCIAPGGMQDNFDAQLEKAAQTTSCDIFRIAYTHFNQQRTAVLFIQDEARCTPEAAQECAQRLLAELPPEMSDCRYQLSHRMENLTQLREAAQTLAQRLLAQDLTPRQSRPLALPASVHWEACSPLMRQILHYLAKSGDSHVSLADVSEYVKLSPNYLSSLIHKETGLRFSELVPAMKIEQAKKLLSDPTIKIYEVGLVLGYDEYPHFYSVFRRATGLSPKEYRARHT